MYGFKKHTKGVHRQKFANGGMVRGPGTGTSDDIEDDVDEGTYIMPADSTEAIGPENLEQMGNDAPKGFKPGAKGKKIPVALSNGEFKLPPEQLQAIGQQVLDQMRAQTHTPAGMRPAAMETDEPRAFFADGGVVDDETRRAQYIDRFGTPQTMSADQTSALQKQSAAYVAGAQARAPQQAAAPATTQPAGFNPEQAARQKINMPASAAGWEADLVRMNNPDADVREEGQGAFWGGVKSALLYNSDVAAEKAKQQASAQPPAAPVSQPAAASTMPAPAGSAAAVTSANPGTSTPPANTTAPKPQGTKPPASPPAPAPSPTAPQIAPGVYKQGRGQYSDNAAGMGFSPGFTGQPSARNMAAADALASRYGAPGVPAQAQAAGPQNLTPKTSGSGFGILDQGYRDRRAAMMDVQQLKPGSRTALTGLLKEQSAANDREAQAAQDETRIGFQRGENALDRGLKAEDLAVRREDAAAVRGFRAQELQDSMQTNAVRREAAGFEVSAARQMQQLRDQYLNGKTPEERNAAAQKLQALSGKEQANKYTVVPGGQEIQIVGGLPTPITRPAMVLDNQTGRFVDQVGGSGQTQQAQQQTANGPARITTKAEHDALPKGTRYIAPDGQILIKN